ncbi:MAG: hypothetical protein SFU86_08600 [Pirellulaceae bacterium]|nr:hypothetical protein [Pirellulaceae bacterium]
MSTNRTSLIGKIHKVLKKHYKPVAPPEERTVLEHLLYACCLEGARPEAADVAFARLRELYYDWNEIRVTTITELAEGMSGIPDPAAAAQRVKRALQSVFETNYQFDLESLKKQNLGKAEKDLEKIQGTTPFVRAYVAQNALAGHAIPVGAGEIDLLHALGVLTDAEADKGLSPGLERAIPKNKGVEFGSLLHQVAADLRASPGSSKLKGILAEIDPDYKDRLAARQERQEAAEEARQAAAKEKRQEARAAAIAAREAAAEEARQAAAKAAAKSARARDKSSPAKATPAKPATPAPPVVPPAAAAPPVAPPAAKDKPKDKDKEAKSKPTSPLKGADDSKKTPSKGLAKKKPR